MKESSSSHNVLYIEGREEQKQDRKRQKQSQPTLIQQALVDYPLFEITLEVNYYFLCTHQVREGVTEACALGQEATRANYTRRFPQDFVEREGRITTQVVLPKNYSQLFFFWITANATQMHTMYMDNEGDRQVTVELKAKGKKKLLLYFEIVK